MLTQQPSLSAEQEELLSLLRTSNLSIKNLDERKRDELRMFLDQLHNSMGFSLNDIAKLLGNKTSGYTSWVCRQLGVLVRPFEEARLKGIREKRRKYQRRPFDGTDEDKAYLLGLRHGDLSVSKPWNGVVRVSTSTTQLWSSCSGLSSSLTGMSTSTRGTRRTPAHTSGMSKSYWTRASPFFFRSSPT